MMQILLISVLLQFGHSAQYEVTEEACANDLLFISSAEECEAAANALGITWNSCCQNDGNLPYGCLKRSDNDVIWNGKTDTVQKFPCSVSGNCAHGMRWAVCYKGDDSVFSSETEKNCCISGWAHDTTCKLGCPNCACLDGNRQCGCIYVSDVDQDDYIQPITPTPPTPQPTPQPAGSSSHFIAAGDYINDFASFDTEDLALCQPDDNNQAALPTNHWGYDIMAGCCELDGSTGVRPDCDPVARTYDEALQLCEVNGYRLCTLQEMLWDRKTNDKGCHFDRAYNWVSTECGTTDFEYTSTEVFDGKSYEIGWIEYSSCTEGDHPQSFNGDYSMADLIELAQSAVTVKILPSTDIPGESETADYALTADLCSNPIFALNHGFTMSYSVGSNLKVSGMADTDNWIGQNAHDLLRNQCGTTSGNTPFSLADGNVYWACGNTAGLHLKTNGCWFDWKTVTGHDITVWLGMDAEGDRVCVEHDDGSYGLQEEEARAHLVVQGRTSWSWGSAPDYYCQSDDDNQAAYATNKHGNNIGVGCCSMDGTVGYRPGCVRPATYQEAVDLCSSTVKNGESLRLCTQQEMLYGKSNGKGITEGTGCWFDAAYQWVSDECDVETDAAAAISNDGSGSDADGDSKSFDDFIPTVLGAAGGIAVSASIVALVVAMRRKKVTEEAVTEMSDVVHIPDTSISATVDGTVTASS